jgi:methionyl-tRNA formyltransferase
MRVLFIGGTRRGYLTLEALVASGAEVAGIVSLRQDEHEAERYEQPIQSLAERHAIPHYPTKWMKDRDYVSLLAGEIRPDVAFIVGCRILIPRSIYEIPPLGMLALHDSLLPHYRGFAPLNWAILNGEKQTGVTLFYLSETMDGGDIVSQKAVPIGPSDTAPEVYERVCQATVDLVLEACPLLASGVAPRIRQDYRIGSFTCSRAPIDGEIDWTRSTAAIFNQVRALAWPYPGAFTFYEGRKLMIWRAAPLDPPPCYVGRVPGRVVAVSRESGEIQILTGDGVLRIIEVQSPGEEKTAAANVVRSVRATLGLNTGDLLARVQALEQIIAGRHTTS